MSLSKQGQGIGRRSGGPNIAISEHPENGNGKASRIAPLLESSPVKEKIGAISAPRMKTIKLTIKGTAPYLQCAFPQKAINSIRAKHEKGDVGNVGKKAKRAPRDFKADFEGSLHRIGPKIFGIPASAFRKAAISACRLVGFKMTLAKMAIFIEADGFDMVDGMPLVRINGTPEQHEMMGRNSDGSCDIRVRGIYREWSVDLRIRFDEDMFGTVDVVNLISRVGQQVGIGEGRPDSRQSAGLGLGLFEVVL